MFILFLIFTNCVQINTLKQRHIGAFKGWCEYIQVISVPLPPSGGKQPDSMVMCVCVCVCVLLLSRSGHAHLFPPPLPVLITSLEIKAESWKKVTLSYLTERHRKLETERTLWVISRGQKNNTLLYSCYLSVSVLPQKQPPSPESEGTDL